jgi:hypothetical protein
MPPNLSESLRIFVNLSESVLEPFRIPPNLYANLVEPLIPYPNSLFRLDYLSLVFILENDGHCFVWCGAKASVDERRKSMEFAHVSTHNTLRYDVDEQTFLGGREGPGGKCTGIHLRIHENLKLSDDCKLKRTYLRKKLQK